VLAMADRTYLVTGASTGIGKACALHLDRRGHHVLAGVRKEEDADRLRREGSTRLTPVMLDIADEARIEAVAKEAAEIVGSTGLAGVVNNAGVARGGPLEYLPMDEWRQQLEINVLGQVAVTKAMLPLIRRAGGRIVFIGSVGGRIAQPLMGPYNASKFAIEGIAESLRQELHPWSIHVSLVEPGAVATEIWAKGKEKADELERTLPAEALQLYGDQVAAIRQGLERQERAGIDPFRVAKVVEHALVSSRPRARYLVGPDAKVGGVLARVLPDRVRDALMRVMTR